jgi:hypothetical protein
MQLGLLVLALASVVLLHSSGRPAGHTHRIARHAMATCMPNMLNFAGRRFLQLTSLPETGDFVRVKKVTSLLELQLN